MWNDKSFGLIDKKTKFMLII